MKTLAWDDRAIDDLTAIADYLAKDSPRAALRVATYIKDKARALETFRELSAASSEPGTREFILTRYPYVLVYEILGDELRILAIFHQQQMRR